MDAAGSGGGRGGKGKRRVLWLTGGGRSRYRPNGAKRQPLLVTLRAVLMPPTGGWSRDPGPRATAQLRFNKSSAFGDARGHRFLSHAEGRGVPGCQSTRHGASRARHCREGFPRIPSASPARATRAQGRKAAEGRPFFPVSRAHPRKPSAIDVMTQGLFDTPAESARGASHLPLFVTREGLRVEAAEQVPVQQAAVHAVLGRGVHQGCPVWPCAARADEQSEGRMSREKQRNANWLEGRKRRSVRQALALRALGGSLEDSKTTRAGAREAVEEPWVPRR